MLLNISQGVKWESILLVEDNDSMRQMLSRTFASEGFEIETARNGSSALQALCSKRYDLVITDLKLNDLDGINVLSAVKDVDTEIQVIIMSAYGSIETAVQAMRQGAYDFITKPFDPEHLLLLAKKALENRRLANQNALLKEVLNSNHQFQEIIGSSPKMKEVMALVQKVAASETTVVLLGESGTGKELFAKAIHHLSNRKENPYVAINCAAIPRELLENELFGSEKGAFTRA